MSSKWYNIIRRGRGLYSRVERLFLKGDLMLDKTIDLARSCAGTKKTCIFFAVFVLTLAMLGGVMNTGVGGEAPMAEDVMVIDPATMTTDAEPVIQTAALTLYDQDHVTAPLSQNLGMEEEEIRKTDKTPELAEILAEHMNVRTARTERKEPDGYAAEQIEEDGQTAPSAGTAAKSDGFVYSESIPMQYELQEYTYQKCVEHGLEYELVLAIMWRESRFDPNAVNINDNGTQDNGIMQINDVNKGWLYEKYGISDLMDPYQNIDAGTAMLGSFAGKYGTHGAMMAYQYGEGGMVRRVGEGQTTSPAVEAAYRQRDYYRDLV